MLRRPHPISWKTLRETLRIHWRFCPQGCQSSQLVCPTDFGLGSPYNHIFQFLELSLSHPHTKCVCICIVCVCVCICIVCVCACVCMYPPVLFLWRTLTQTPTTVVLRIRQNLFLLLAPKKNLKYNYILYVIVWGGQSPQRVHRVTQYANSLRSKVGVEFL